jgi:hypothetical protein
MVALKDVERTGGLPEVMRRDAMIKEDESDSAENWTRELDWQVYRREAREGELLLHRYKGLSDPWTHGNCLVDILKELLTFCHFREEDFDEALAEARGMVTQRINSLGDEIARQKARTSKGSYRISACQVTYLWKYQDIHADSLKDAEDWGEKWFLRDKSMDGEGHRETGEIFTSVSAIDSRKSCADPNDDRCPGIHITHRLEV